jgi:hypothetical protein
MSEVSRAFSDRSRQRALRRRRPAAPALATIEPLESRLALFSPFPIQVTQIPSGSGPANGLEILFSQGGTITADQHVVIDIDRVFPALGTPQTRVNVYASTNPAANPSQPGTAYTNIDYIRVVVPNYDVAGTNNNSLTIKGMALPTDRIIISGSGRTAAGRWSDESGSELQVAFDIEGIDDTTVVAGGVINVSGAFTNDTADASITAIGEIAERSDDQQTGTVVVGETTPTPIGLPQPRLTSDFVQIIGAELDIYSTIVASRQVILRAAESAPGDARANLVLPYDITVTDPANGVVELHSTRNITQLQSSTITARKLVAVSNNSNPIPPGTGLDGNAWNIDLGSVNNDFDEIALGMIAAPGDQTDTATQGRIGVRDIDDLTVTDFGILALTGQVTLRAGGLLTIDSAVQARGLVAQSEFGITSTTKADMRILGVPNNDANAAGDIVLMASATAPGASGDINLNGRIDLGDRDWQGTATSTIYNIRMVASGTTTVAGGLYAPVSTQLLVESDQGIEIASPVQMGSTVLDPLAADVQVFRGGISLISNGQGSAGIAVRNRPGNLNTPQTLQATEAIALESTGDIRIEGAVLAGTVYGDPSKLAETAALPSITIKTPGIVDMSATGSLRTVAYGTDPDATTNPMVGLISISGASQVNGAGSITADGAVAINVVGDVSLAGPTTGRENVVVKTSAGSIGIQGAVVSTGGTYTEAVTPGSQREPNVILSAINGSIATSNAGTLRAGTVTVDGSTTYGTVTLEAQQDIEIGAAINTPGAVEIDSKLGQVAISALLQTNNAKAMVISAGNGVVESDKTFGRIVTDSLTVTNTGAAGGASDIDLRAINNQIKGVVASNFSDGGGVFIANNGALAIGGIVAERGGLVNSVISLASTAGITQTGAIVGNDLTVANRSANAIALSNPQNNVDRFAASNPTGDVLFTDADGFETGVTRPALPATVPVEIRGVNVQLSSAEPYSTIRVVSGLQYRSLSIGAGNANGAAVGTVEFVPTSTIDNPAAAGLAPTFAGTLRDMIGYINDNTAVYLANQTNRSQPMAMVFDEEGYQVDTIELEAALPTFNRAVTFDGGRLEANLLAAGQTRLEITPAVGATTLPYGLSFAAAVAAVPGRTPAYPGSAGSTIQHVAMYGFTGGSALVLASGNNTVSNFYAGLRADGFADATTRNRVGLDITGTAATNNLVGSRVVDPATVNRFGGNTSAGILIRNGASGTRVYGNVIGDDTGFAPALANGDGIRIATSTGNLIGTPDAAQPDMTDSLSNVIAGNTGSGVAIRNSIAGSAGAANVLRNNRIAANGVGVAVIGSRFVRLGGADGESGNTVISQAADGIAVTNSSDVQLLGNRIGIDPATDFLPESLAGNKGNGVSITGTSQRVNIAAGNRISANSLNGVSIGTGVTAVTITGSTLGGLLDDGVTAAGNGIDGVVINAAIGNTVGAGNTISHNGRNGASVVDARSTALLSGNRITGSTIVANGAHGVYVSGGSASTVGGTTAGAGNVIQANTRSGVYLESSSRTGAATGHAIQGNFVGTNTNRDVDSGLGNLAGGIVVNDGVGVRIESNTVMNNLRAPDPNNANDPNDGITLRGGSGTVVGGATTGLGNLVTNNQRDGIRVVGPSADRAAQGHWITGNTISNNGNPGNNTGNGVCVTGAFARSITVGQVVTTAGVRGLGNVIQSNARFGVVVAGGAQQAAIQGNSIAGNLVGGISIAAGSNTSTAAGITLSKATIRQPVGSRPQILLEGSLSGAVRGQQYTVDVYANSPQDSLSGGYQGRRFLGRVTVTATANGTIAWGARNPLALSANVAVGEFITATVTALRVEPGSTSTLSAGVQATR